MDRLIIAKLQALATCYDGFLHVAMNRISFILLQTVDLNVAVGSKLLLISIVAIHICG